MLLWLNWKLTLGTVTLLGIFAVGMSIAFKRLRPIFRERGRINADVTGRLAETIGGIRLVKVYTAEERERDVFSDGVMTLFRNIASTITGTSATTALSTAVVGLISVLVMVFGGRAVIAGSMTLGDLFMYVFFIGLVAAPLVQIANIGTQITEAFAGLDRIRELRDMATEDEEDESRPAMPPLARRRRVRGRVVRVRGGHAGAQGRLLHRAGRHHHGARGLERLGQEHAHLAGDGVRRARSRGALLVDGTDLATLKLHDYRRQLGVVLQDNFLFDGTVRENIAFTRPGATDDEVLEVCAHRQRATSSSSRFADGYDTIVGERGVKLSGGQRQRVAIARAILADPRMLILDEATSTLDSESEQLIQEGLQRLRAGRTTFVIAHRLSTITQRRPDPRARGRARSWSAARTRSCWRSTAGTATCTTASTASSRTAS